MDSSMDSSTDDGGESLSLRIRALHVTPHRSTMQPPRPSEPEETDDGASLLLPKPSPTPSSHLLRSSLYDGLSLRALLLYLRYLLSTTPLHLRVLAALTLLLLLDCLIHPPHGLLPLRLFTGAPTHGEAEVCGWDYEGSWKIGIARGRSPLTLSLSHPSAHLNPVLTCASVPSPPSSFVADPFLLVADQVHWVFAEVKDLNAMLGVIGVWKARDAQLTGLQWVGVALEESFHLSYPFVLWCSEAVEDGQRGLYAMIPETSASHSVSVYTARAADFPLRWTLHSVPLTGHRFVDTSAIQHDGRWYIFTTYDDSLHLYTADALLSSAWTLHRLSPLVSHDRRIARSAGRPFVYDGRIHRLAQDDSQIYGAAVYVMEVEELSEPTSDDRWKPPFSEREVARLTPGPQPSQGSEWVTERLHHLDVHRLPDGSWMALLDGDATPEDFEFWRREGWFRRLKDVLLVLALTATVGVAGRLWLKRHAQVERPPSTGSSPDSPRSPRSPRRLTSRLSMALSRSTGCARLSWSLVWMGCELLFLGAAVFAAVVFVLARFWPLCTDGWSGYALESPLTSSLRQMEDSITVPTLPTQGQLSVVPGAAVGAPQLAELMSPSFLASARPLPFFPFPGFVVATAASSTYFDRLQNFVGSVHLWEPAQSIVVYDLGLTPEQAAAVRCWQRVTLQAFPFHAYPLHVRNLFNYAWKLLMLEHAFLSLNASAVLVLDSGVELRQPYALSSIKQQIAERGYWTPLQSNFVDLKTVPATLDALSVDTAFVRGRPFCAGGLTGFMRGSAAYAEVALPAMECAKVEACIAPAGSGRSTHNFDQSVLSALVWATGRRCDDRREYREWDMSLVTEEESDYNDIVLSLRRWHQPKPYIRHVQQLLSAACPYIPPLARALVEYPQAPPVDVRTMGAEVEQLLIPHSDTQRLEDDSALVQCLRRSANSRARCREELSEHEMAMIEADVDNNAWLDVEGHRVLRRMRCQTNWLITVVLTLAVWHVRSLWAVVTVTRSRVVAVSVVVAAVLAWPLYVALLNEYGTFSPLAVLFTRQFVPAVPYFVPAFYPSASVPDELLPRPPFRVVFTLSTLPHHVHFVNDTLTSLALQSVPPDAIHLNLPLTNHRTGEAYAPPQYLMQGAWLGVPLIINRGEDVGPLTKLLPTLLKEQAADTLIIAVDTDKTYHEHLAANLAYHSLNAPDVAFGACGWSFLFRPAPVGVLPVYVPWAMRGTYGREVDVLQAVCGNAYRRAMFPAVGSADMERFQSPHVACFTTDDLWTAGWLALHHTRRVLLPGGWSMLSQASMEPSTADWKAALNEAERREGGPGGRWDLSAINKAPGVDMACIRGVEQTVGPWREVRRRDRQGSASPP